MEFISIKGAKWKQTTAFALGTVLFHREYSAEHINIIITGADENTFRLRAKPFVLLLADLKMVSDIFCYFFMCILTS